MAELDREDLEDISVVGFESLWLLWGRDCCSGRRLCSGSVSVYTFCLRVMGWMGCLWRCNGENVI